jgi:hypothetical protein
VRHAITLAAQKAPQCLVHGCVLTCLSSSLCAIPHSVVWEPPRNGHHSRWAGPPSFLAHRVRSPAAFALSAADFERVRLSKIGGFVRYCSGHTNRAWHRKARQTFCNGRGELSMPCTPWLLDFPQLKGFKCCSAWQICRAPRALPRPRKGYNVTRRYWHAQSRYAEIGRAP